MMWSARTSHPDGEYRGAVYADAVAGLAVVLAAGSGADLSDGVALARSRFPGVSGIDPVPGVVLHRRVRLTAAGQGQGAACLDHAGRMSQNRGVLGGIWRTEDKTQRGQKTRRRKDKREKWGLAGAKDWLIGFSRTNKGSSVVIFISLRNLIQIRWAWLSYIKSQLHYRI